MFTAEDFKMMVEDWWDEDVAGDDLEVVGEPYYSEDYGAWVQDAKDSKNTYVLVADGGNIRLEYCGAI